VKVINSKITRRCTRPPTAYATPRASAPLRLPAAGELGRCVAARGLDGDAAAFWAVVAENYRHFPQVGWSAKFFFGLAVVSLCGRSDSFGFFSAQLVGFGAASWDSCGAAFLLWRGFWVSAANTFRSWRSVSVGAAGGGSNVITATQQGDAPDRLQLRSFLTSLPAAGELSR
jgi:hypothetical protein